jgi:hypothetical protein
MHILDPAEPGGDGVYFMICHAWVFWDETKNMFFLKLRGSAVK